jgi:hypothetical protein
LVAQWVSTKGGTPALVFWDTGSQVTLVTQKAAHTLGFTAIPSSPLRSVRVTVHERRHVSKFR